MFILRSENQVISGDGHFLKFVEEPVRHVAGAASRIEIEIWRSTHANDLGTGAMLVDRVVLDPNTHPGDARQFISHAHALKQ